MTVCIVASCTIYPKNRPYKGPGVAIRLSPKPVSGIVGISDRMLSNEYDSWEPEQPKFFSLQSQVLSWYSGDPGEALVILRQAKAKLSKRKKPAGVEEAAECVADFYRRLLYRRIAETYAAPLGVEIEDLSPNERERARNHVIECSLIVAGVDDSGAHIFRVDSPGQARCRDADGFTVIGNGDIVAAHHLADVGWTGGRPLPEALTTIYTAKRRAEVALGVGSKFDLAIIDGRKGSYYLQPLLDHLEKSHRMQRESEQRAHLQAVKKLEILLSSDTPPYRYEV
jgi:20S proteasome alpha/beta subunit